MASLSLASMKAQSPASSPVKSLGLSPKQAPASHSPSTIAPSTSLSSSPVVDSPPSPSSLSPAKKQIASFDQLALRVPHGQNTNASNKISTWNSTSVDPCPLVRGEPFSRFNFRSDLPNCNNNWSLQI
ncbi:hypothetical protein ACFX14_042397 [Malus domestica]